MAHQMGLYRGLGDLSETRLGLEIAMVETALPRARLARIRRAQNRTAPPADFEEFWLRTLDELLLTSPRVQSTSASGTESHPATAAEMISLGGVKVRLWFSGARREGASLPPKPLLVTSHGYGGQVDAERVRRLASFGMDVAAVDARGFGLSRDAVSGLSPHGYVLTGCQSEQSSILRGAVCDFLQAYRAAQSWFGMPSRVTFQGFSFAGGLALMAAGVLAMVADSSPLAWLPPPELLAVGVPTFGYLEKRLLKCEAGSGKEVIDYLRLHPQRKHALLRVLSYFDTTYFAPYVRAHGNGRPTSVLAGLGTYDPVVPPETVYAICNALPSQPSLMEMPCSHTSRPEEAEWMRWESAWIRAARRGSGRPVGPTRA